MEALALLEEGWCLVENCLFAARLTARIRRCVQCRVRTLCRYSVDWTDGWKKTDDAAAEVECQEHDLQTRDKFRDSEISAMFIAQCSTKITKLWDELELLQSNRTHFFDEFHKLLRLITHKYCQDQNHLVRGKMYPPHPAPLKFRSTHVTGWFRHEDWRWVGKGKWVVVCIHKLTL